MTADRQLASRGRGNITTGLESIAESPNRLTSTSNNPVVPLVPLEIASKSVRAEDVSSHFVVGPHFPLHARSLMMTGLVQGCMTGLGLRKPAMPITRTRLPLLWGSVELGQIIRQQISVSHELGITGLPIKILPPEQLSLLHQLHTTAINTPRLGY